MLHKCVMACVLLVGVVVGDGSVVDAAVISSWNLDDSTALPGGSGVWGPSPFNPNNGTDANVAVGGLTRGSGVGATGSAAGRAWGGTAWDGNASLSAAVTAGDFITFTLLANSGHELSLSSIDSYNIRRSGTGPTTGQWQYSLNGSAFADIGGPITWGATTSATGNEQSAIDLSSIAALQNLSDSTTVMFRVVNWNASSSGGTWYFNGAGGGSSSTTLTINGTATAVPEPAAFGLIGLGMVGALSMIRRRRLMDKFAV